MAKTAEPDGNRRPDGRFSHGNRANPGGRPKSVARVVALARQHTEEAIRNLAEIMGDPGQKGAARVKAAEVLLDRGWGKAPQTVEHKSPFNELDDETKLRAARRAIEKRLAEQEDAKIH